MTSNQWEHIKKKVDKKVIKFKESLKVNGQRNETCLRNYTIPNIKQTALNSYLIGMNSKEKDPFQLVVNSYSNDRINLKNNNQLHTFSNPGMSAVDHATGIDISDVSSYIAIQSVVPYFCIERSLSQPKELINFKVWVASQNNNGNGGLQAGQGILDPLRMPVVTNLNPSKQRKYLSPDVINNSIISTVPVLRNSLFIYAIEDGVEVLIGEDRNGMIITSDGSRIVNGTFDYQTGKLNIDFGANIGTNPLIIQFGIDTASNSTTTVRTTPAIRTFQIEVSPIQIISEGSLIATAFYDTAIQRAALESGISYDPMADSVRHMTQVVLDFVNNQVAQCLLDISQQIEDRALPVPSIDISDPSQLSFPGKFNEYMHKFFVSLNSQMARQLRSSRITAIGVSQSGQNLLERLTDGSYETNPIEDGFDTVNTLIGNWKGVPVIKLSLLEHKVENGIAGFWAVYKTPDGELGPMCRAVFIEAVTTEVVYSHDDPTQWARSLFAYSKVQELVSIDPNDRQLPGNNCLVYGEVRE